MWEHNVSEAKALFPTINRGNLRHRCTIRGSTFDVHHDTLIGSMFGDWAVQMYKIVWCRVSLCTYGALLFRHLPVDPH